LLQSTGKNDHWVDIQLKYLSKNIKTPYKVYAFLNSLPRDHQKKYFYSSTEEITLHEIKLNLLADMAILHSTNDDDWLIFIDGDAFPIGDIVSFARSKLREYSLLAIQRRENAGDIQPHPSFCLTTVGFWKEINGDWKPGYEWRDTNGNKITDVGANLLSILEKKKIKWLPLLRSNKRDLHKLWFGIYEDLTYHHGAGFREPISRVDLRDLGITCIPSTKNRLLKRIYREIGRVIRRRIKKKNAFLVEEVYQSILSDTYFYQYFQESDQS